METYDPVSGTTILKPWGTAVYNDLLDHETRVTELETRVGCILRRANNQSIANNTSTPVSWDTADANPQNFITVHATTGTTITIPTGYGGLYAISMWLNLPNMAAATRVFGEFAFTYGSGGTGYPDRFRATSSATEDDVWCSISDILLPEGSTVICNVYHNEGSAQNMQGWLSMHRRQE